MKTYWALGFAKKHIKPSDKIKRVFFIGLSFPFQVKQFRYNPKVVILPNGKYVSKDFLDYA